MAGGQNSNDLERYLREVLSRQGPQQLPYKEDAKWVVRQHVKDLATEIPSLTVKAEQYTYENGRTVNALKEIGTIPMYYQNNKYNIPVAMWLAEGYPHSPPIVYVEPTPDMIIKPRHSFVDSSGIVDIPYLREWAFQRSNLVDLSYSLGISFGEDPPLFSKPPGWTPPPPQQQPPQHQQPFHNPMVSRPPGPAAAANPYATAAPNLPPQQQQQPAAAANPYANPYTFHNPYAQQQQQPPPPPPQQQQQQQPPRPPQQQPHQQQQQHTPPPPPPRPQQHQTSGPVVNPAELAFRKAAMATLKQRLQASISANNTKVNRQLAAVGDVAKELDVRHANLTSGLRAIEAERTALERNVGAMVSKTAELDEWLAKHEGKASSLGGEGGSFSADDLEAAIVPADALSRQALKAAAEDMAIEDTLYSLERGLQNGIVEPEAYLKQVRKLCRKQFFPRSLGLKIAEMQQAQRSTTTTTARSGSGGSQGAQQSLSLPQGDSWIHTSGHFQRSTASPHHPQPPPGAAASGFTNPLHP